MSNLYSITYRPELSEFQSHHLEFAKVIKKISTEYYIGYEKGSCEEVSHLQIHMATTSNSVGDLRKVIRNNFKAHVITPINLHCRKIKIDAMYQLGYCQKEQVKCETNMPADKINTAAAVYEEKKDLPKRKAECFVKNCDWVYEMFFKVCKEKGILPRIIHMKTFCIHLLDTKRITVATYNKMNWKNMEEVIQFKNECIDKDMWADVEF